MSLAPVLLSTLVALGAPAIPKAQAERVFEQARALCHSDHGRLWGVSLCGNLMYVDPNTREAIANHAVPGAVRDGDSYRFTLPASVPISVAPLEYDGVRWAQMIWPLPASADERAVELMHESFHRIQPKLGFNGYRDTGVAGNAYLDVKSGRVWFRGELHALRAALQSRGSARTTAVRDAITMRLYRQSLFAGAKEAEREQDIMEGLAENTGIDIALPASRRIAYALHDLDLVERQSYVRSFPYATGPAYGELLDLATPNWRHRITAASDVAVSVAHAYAARTARPTGTQAEAAILRYGGRTIVAEESARALRKVALDRKYASELIHGATLTLPMIRFNITFDPSGVEALGSSGSVYHTLKVNATWGSIVVAGGDAMISKDFRYLIAPAIQVTSGSAIAGQGWRLNLAEGWSLTADPKKRGSYIVTQASTPAPTPSFP